jgi:hypothetical protein
VAPGKDKEANWLPSPKGDFALFLRLYWPNEKAPSILDGSWIPPQVRAVKQPQDGPGIKRLGKSLGGGWLANLKLSELPPGTQ